MLYLLHWSERPFVPGRQYRVGKVGSNITHYTLSTPILYLHSIYPLLTIYTLRTQVVHNMWYTLLGVVQYTVWEAAYLHCCATGRIPYLRSHSGNTQLRSEIPSRYASLVTRWRPPARTTSPSSWPPHSGCRSTGSSTSTSHTGRCR